MWFICKEKNPKLCVVNENGPCPFVAARTVIFDIVNGSESTLDLCNWHAGQLIRANTLTNVIKNKE